MQCQKDGLGNLKVVFGVSGCKQVILDAQMLKQVQITIVVLLVDLLDRLAECVSLNHDRSAMRIRSRHHQDLVSL